jgi:hypothetical protein
MKNSPKHISVLESLADAAARSEEDEGRPTPASRAAARRYQAIISDKLAEMRRAELERHGPATVERAPIPGWLLAMPRAALETMLRAMCDSSPSLGFAHRNLTEVTDDDLRTMIQDAQWTLGYKP